MKNTHRVTNKGATIINKPTAMSMGPHKHRHNLNVDVHGNGITIGGKDHEHKVNNFQVGMACPDGQKCHSH